ncbi:MAG TPA: von Willebrand factor type A domain-containing protein, partial [Mucilaginibacter sp.]
MKKILLIVLLFTGLTGFKQGDIRHISGTVYGSDDKKPIPGVTVKVEGTNTAALTDAAGKFTIDVPDGKEYLSVSFIGYKTQRVKLGKDSALKIYLEPSSNALSEVVITGYTAKRKKEITGSVAVISADHMVAPNQPIDILKGRASGVVVTSYNKAPAPVQYNYSPPLVTDNESYKGINENGFNDVVNNPLSTFSVDVDGASYTNVRRFLNNGQLPPA